MYVMLPRGGNVKWQRRREMPWRTWPTEVIKMEFIHLDIKFKWKFFFCLMQSEDEDSLEMVLRSKPVPFHSVETWMNFLPAPCPHSAGPTLRGYIEWGERGKKIKTKIHVSSRNLWMKESVLILQLTMWRHK